MYTYHFSQSNLLLALQFAVFKLGIIISEGAAPCPYCLVPCPHSLAPCPIYIAPARIKYIAVFTYQCLQVCVHVFIDRPGLASFACWIVPKFWLFTRKPDLVVRALNCAQFFVSCMLNYAQILVVRALDCVLFFLHPAVFPT